MLRNNNVFKSVDEDDDEENMSKSEISKNFAIEIVT